MNHCRGFWILPCKEAIQLSLQNTSGSIRVPARTWNNTWKVSQGFPPEVKAGKITIWPLQCWCTLKLRISYLLSFITALILEEIAIDSHNKEVEDKLLTEAQELHLQSLALARKAFGENNVQTAKHYGNLGRLYQSMHNFEVSFNLRLI